MNNLHADYIAKLTGKRHTNLVRSIEGYIIALENKGMNPEDYFISNKYIGRNSSIYDTFDITKLGCDIIYNHVRDFRKREKFRNEYMKHFSKQEKNIPDPIEEKNNIPKVLIDGKEIVSEVFNSTIVQNKDQSIKFEKINSDQKNTSDDSLEKIYTDMKKELLLQLYNSTGKETIRLAKALVDIEDNIKDLLK